METKETKDTEINTKDIGWKPRLLYGSQGYRIETKYIEWKPRISDGNQ